MKAIIVEIKGNHAAVLSDDGVVSKIRNKDYYIGQEIAIKNNSGKLIRMTAAAAAAIMIFVTPAWAYLTPYSYVSVDVDPSFEFLINRFDRVLTVRAFSDEGSQLSKDISIDGLKNKEIQSAVKSVLNELKSKGYIIEGEEDGVIVAASSKSEKKTNMLSEKLRTAVDEEVTLKHADTEIEAKQYSELEKAEKPVKPEKPEKPVESDEQEKTEKQEKSEEQEEIKDIEESAAPETEATEKPEEQESEKPNKSERKNYNIKVIEVTEQEVDEAKKLKITPGKFNLIRKLKEAANSAGLEHEINQDDWLYESVKEINAKIKEYREMLKENESKGSNKND